MTEITPRLKLFLDIAKITSIMGRRFDARLWGLSFSDFTVLFYLSQSSDQKMCRIDLAEKIGLTASGVTRILLPMEKIGLVTREINEYDARVSYVLLAPGGKMKLKEALERAELACEEVMPDHRAKKAEEISRFLADIGSL